MKNFIKQFFKHEEPPIIIIDETSIIIKVLYKNKEPSHLYAIIKQDTINISDIKSSVRRKGHGTIMMEILIREARALHIKQITGNIDKEDAFYIDRLKHFYGKFGFIVKPIYHDPQWKYQITLNL